MVCFDGVVVRDFGILERGVILYGKIFKSTGGTVAMPTEPMYEGRVNANLNTGKHGRDVHAQRHVRRELGISDDSPLPRCPCRSQSTANRLAAEGDHTHTIDGKHVCLDCRCRRVAGTGTDHYGYGPCVQHEKNYSDPWKLEAVVKAHKEALMSANPGVYRDVGRFAEMVRRTGEESAKRISLDEDLQIARGTVQELIAYARNDGTDLNGHTLMEYVGENLRPMSDKTRMSLIGTLLPKVAKLAQVEKEFREDQTIPIDYFRVWFGRLWSELQALAIRIAEGDLQGREAVEIAFKEMFERLGDPRHTS